MPPDSFITLYPKSPGFNPSLGLQLKNKTTENKKENKHFLKDFKAELKKVIWPTPKQLVNNTVAVITIVLLIAVIVFVLDFTFEKMNTYGINKLKSIVETTNTEATNAIDENVSVNEIQESVNEAVENTNIVAE